MLGLGNKVTKKLISGPTVIPTGRSVWAPFNKPDESQEDLTNGDFGSGDFTGWTAYTDATLSTQEVVSHDGHSTAAHIVTSIADRGYYQTANPSQTYLVSFDIKVVDGGVYLGKSDNKVGDRNFTDASWTSYSFYWTQAAADNKIRFYSSAGDGNEFYIDNVSMKKVTAFTGQALEFDGINDRIDFARNVGGLETELTISAWVKKDVGDRGAICAYNSGGAYFKFNGADNLVFFVPSSDGSSSIVLTDGTGFVDDGEWKFIVATFNGATGAKMYINGALVSSDTTALTSLKSDTGNFRQVGAYNNGTDANDMFGGKMANLQVWNKEWSADDVTYAYTNRESLVNLPYENLKVWYPMQGGHRGNQSYLIDGANTGLGNEIITSDMSWDLTSTGSNWSQNGTAFTSDGSATGRVFVSGAGSIVVGKTYKISYDITAYTSGAVRVELGTSADAAAVSNSGIGSFSTYFTAKSNTNIYINQSGLAFVGTFDNLSIKPVSDKNNGTSVFYGPQLLTNTDFGSSATGWTAGTDMTISSESGLLRVTNDASGSPDMFCSQSFTTVAGRSYRAQITLKNETTIQGEVYINNSVATGSALASDTDIAADDVVDLTFTATASTTHLILKNSVATSNRYTEWDDASVREVGFATGWSNADAEPIIPQLGFQKFNEMLWLDGAADYVTIDGLSSTIQSLEVGSISGWFIVSKAPAVSGVIFSASDDGDADSDLMILVMANGHLRFHVREAGTLSLQRTYETSVIDGKWHHFVLTVDTGGNALYLDGVLATLADGTGDEDTQKFFNDVNTIDSVTIGANQHNSSGAVYESFFNGSITEISVWNGALTSAQVQELYNDGKALNATLHSRVIASSSDLIGYWRNSGKEAWYDLSNTNNNSGTTASASEYLLLPKGHDERDTQGFIMNKSFTSGIFAPLDSDYTGYVDLGSTTTLADDANWSLTVWLKPSTLTDNVFLGNANDFISIDTANRIELNAASTTYLLNYKKDGESASAFAINTWYHIGITRGSDDELRLYVNGILQDDPVADGSGDHKDFNAVFRYRYLGSGSSTANHFMGIVDDLAIYDATELSASQIERNYKAGKRRHQD